MKLLIALLLLLTSTLSLAFPTLPPIPDIFNGTSSLAPRNKDGVHCCDNNGRGWKYVPVKKFEPLIHDLKDYYFGNDHNIQLTPGPAACKSLEPCRGGAQILICNDQRNWIAPDRLYIASYAEDIIRQCSVYKEVSHAIFAWQVCGQEFDTDQYNVILKGC